MRTKIAIRLDAPSLAYIRAEQERRGGTTASEIINEIIERHTANAVPIEDAITQAVETVQQQAQTNQAELVALLSTVLEALLKLIETSTAPPQMTAGQRAALFQSGR